MQDRWVTRIKELENALQKAKEEYEGKYQNLNDKYEDEVSKGIKLQAEVEGLTAKVEELDKLICPCRREAADGDVEGPLDGRRVYATCPCQKAASVKMAALSKENQNLREEWGKDKRRVGLYRFHKQKRSKESTGYHRGYVFKEERVVAPERTANHGEPIVEEEEDEQQSLPRDMNVKALERAARDLVENLVYLTDGGLKNTAKVFQRFLRNPTIKTVMQEVHGFALLQSKDHKDLVQLKKIVGGVSLALEKMLKHISAEQCRIAYSCVAFAFAPDIDNADSLQGLREEFKTVEKWTCFSKRKLEQAAELRRDFFSESWKKYKDDGDDGPGQPSIYAPHKAKRRDSAEVSKKEHIDHIREAWIINSKDSPAMHNFSKDPECTAKHTFTKVDGCIVCPVDCNKKHIRFAEMTTTEVYGFIQKWPVVPAHIRNGITRTMVGDYRPHWVRDRKLDDSKCPTHEAVNLALEDYNSQSKDLHARYDFQSFLRTSLPCRVMHD